MTRVKTFGLLILVSMFPLFSSLLVPIRADTLPTPTDLIIVHTTTINVTGPPSQNFTMNIQKLDNVSFITKLNFNLSFPTNNFTIRIYHMNTLPPSLTPSGGRTLLSFYFNLNSGVLGNMTQASFYLKVPILELSEFSVSVETLRVQQFIPNSWSLAPALLNNTDANYYNYYVFASNLTLFAVTGLQARGLPPTVILPLIITIVASSFVITRKSSRSRPLIKNPS